MKSRVLVPVYLLGLAAIAALIVVKSKSPKDQPAAVVKVPVAAKFEIVDNRAALRAFPDGLAAQFSGAKAYAHVKALCEIGPRPPGSPGYEKALVYAEKEFAAHGWMTQRQSFSARTPDGEITFTNLIARFRAIQTPWTASTPLVIAGHYDTKKIKEFPFLGANDSGSSSGVILEMARVLAADPAAASSVEFVLFDGEEALGGGITPTDGLYGSKYFARQLMQRTTQPSLGIVLDLVGDIRQRFFYNPDAPPAFARKVAAAAKIHSWNLMESEGEIIDDHVPLQNAGLPCLHLIGAFMEMPYWHQRGDTLEVISPEALEKTGRSVLTTLAGPQH